MTFPQNPDRADQPSTLPRLVPVPPGHKVVPHGYRRKTIVTPALETQIASMVAVGGVSQTQAARATGVAVTTVQSILKKPEVQRTIAEMREATREISLSKAVAVAESSWDWLAEVVKSRDSRAFDQITRGLAALERTSSSASGEARRLDAVVTTTKDLVTEADDVLRALLGLPRQ